jgi:putative transposase
MQSISKRVFTHEYRVTLHQNSGHIKSRNFGMIDLEGKEHAMRKSRFTEEQIAYALKQSELGTKVEEIWRKMGISDATFYEWRQKYGGMGTSELRKMKQLEEENAKLKRLVTDLSLDKIMRQDVLSKKL